MLRIGALAGTPIEIISPRLESAETLPYEAVSSRFTPVHPPDEAILHALAFSVTPENEDATADSIATILAPRRPFATEVYGRHYRLFFESAESAAATAIAICSVVGAQLEHSLGLHSLPVRKRVHPVTGSIAFSAALGDKAAQLAELDPPAQIYATTGFSAFSEQNDGRQLRCEFLGHRALGHDGQSEAIFRVVRWQHV